MFLNVVYCCLPSPINIAFINGFCACNGTDSNKPALSSKTTLLILKEMALFFYCYNYKIYKYFRKFVS